MTIPDTGALFILKWKHGTEGGMLALEMKEENTADPFNLGRFIEAQEGVFERALKELTQGHKRTHWMWFIFPQIVGLGRSRTSIYYSIGNAAEGQAFLKHPVLGRRLVDATKVILELEGLSISRIFGFPDDLKFRSSMTLFAEVSGGKSVFHQVLEKYFSGEGDARTLELLSVS